VRCAAAPEPSGVAAGSVLTVQGVVTMPRDPVIANQKKILANQKKILAKK
jgi:hypothetical protein